MIDLDAIRARCNEVDELRATYPWMWAEYVSDPTAASKDRENLLSEVERLRTCLRAILGEAETDFDRGIIFTECQAALEGGY